MKNMKFWHLIRIFAGLVLFGCSLGMLTGCVDLTVQSAWKDHEIVFDGKNTEWLQAMVKAKNVDFGIFNDDENLYLCFSITDKVTKAQMMGLFKQDFYIWVDTETGKFDKKLRNFGFRFSNGSPFMDQEMLTKTRFLQVHAFQVIADEMMSHLSIQVIQKHKPAMPVSEAKGIDSGIWVFKDGRHLVYELKLPLTKSAEHPYGIGAAPGETVYLGLETTPIDVAMLENELGINEYDQIRSAVEQERMYGRDGVRRGMSAVQRKYFEAEIALENFRPIQVWCKVILARKS